MKLGNLLLVTIKRFNLITMDNQKTPGDSRVTGVFLFCFHLLEFPPGPFVVRLRNAEVPERRRPGTQKALPRCVPRQLAPTGPCQHSCTEPLSSVGIPGDQQSESARYSEAKFPPV